MDTVDDDAHVLDRFALHFGHAGFDLQSDASLSSTVLHTNHHHHVGHHHHHSSSDTDFGGVVDGAMAGDSLSMDHHHGYYNDPNLAASNILDVSQSAMYDDTAFSSINLSVVGSDLVDNGSNQMTTSSVVDAVASGNESKIYEMDRQNVSGFRIL